MIVRSVASTEASRVRLRIDGVVQGVGFRPYVYRLAHQLGLAGHVLNDSHGVLVEVEGPKEVVQQFIVRLEPEAPPLAVLEQIISERLEPTGTGGFAILASDRGAQPNATVTADTATCADCLRELFDPGDRRFRYPFINCTNCGPRFTIVRGVPYDRRLTTMCGFRMCPQCEAEYNDPGDRRFHAQPNACPTCGPRVSLLDARPAVAAEEPIRAAAGALAGGAILALKGIGGYHLACRAEDDSVVARLRARKHREDRPFALMAGDLDSASRLVELGPRERELLTSAQRPIVLAPVLADAGIAPSVAPGAPELGVMLPYSPLHHLLLADAGCPLVMTSANVSDEPIAYRDEDALTRLAGLADLFLIHDRPIETRTDDSVVRAVQCRGRSRTAFVRRSRGYVPASLPLPGGGTAMPLLACGAELKNTFCVAKGTRAWVSHHIGDLENYETLRSFLEGIEHFERLFAVVPEVVAYDLHPEYLSTKYALGRPGVELVGVQHHHAHLAACLAEHGEPGPAIGAIFDGTGYGTDGGLWGGELLHGDLAGFRRIGHLRSVPLPGGAQAIRQPWRIACAWLIEAESDVPAVPAALAATVDPGSWGRVLRLARSGLSSPATTSIGRLFDAVAALCGLRAEINYESQAAIELEAACDPCERGSYPIAVTATPVGGLEIDPRETIVAIVADLGRGARVGTVASRFHGAIAAATIEACTSAARAHGCEAAVLSGGVFANRRLLQRIADGLTVAGLRVLTPERLPAGDGGISYGQAAVAAARIGS